MFYVLISFTILVALYGPTVWVRYILWKYSYDIPDMPGTGGELAEHLIERFELDGVQLKAGNKGDNYYSPKENLVSLSPDVFEKKSLTAVATAAHEIGHALQFNRKEPISLLREKYLQYAFQIKNTGVYLMSAIALMSFLVKTPLLMLAAAIIGIASMLSSVLMYAAILPEELDASFNKALPILQEGYVPPTHIPAIRRILKACAYTYVAAALSDVLNLWRWFRILR